MTEHTLQALAILRDPGQFKWYVIPLLAFVFYVYTIEAEKRNWPVIMAGLAFWGWTGLTKSGIPLSCISLGMRRCGARQGIPPS